MSPLYSGFSVASSQDKNGAFSLGEQLGRGEKEDRWRCKRARISTHRWKKRTYK
jgi:hypothetical protein